MLWNSSPINSLPVELLSYIFYLGTHESLDSDRDDDECQPFNSDSVKTPLVYASVSRHWRRVALSTPGLFTSLCITPALFRQNGTEEVLDMTGISAYLTLSRNCLVDILIDARDQEWDFEDDGAWFSAEHMSVAMSVLLPHLARWRSLSILTDVWAPMHAALQPLEVNLSAFGAPHLDSLRLMRPRARTRLSVLGDQRRKDIPSGVLTDELQSLELSFHPLPAQPSVSELAALLQVTPNLTRLVMNGSGPAVDPQAPWRPHEDTPLPLLTTLTLGYTSAASGIALLEILAFHTPNVHTLTLEDASHPADTIPVDASPLLAILFHAVPFDFTKYFFPALEHLALRRVHLTEPPPPTGINSLELYATHPQALGLRPHTLCVRGPLAIPSAASVLTPEAGMTATGAMLRALVEKQRFLAPREICLHEAAYASAGAEEEVEEVWVGDTKIRVFRRLEGQGDEDDDEDTVMGSDPEYEEEAFKVGGVFNDPAFDARYGSVAAQETRNPTTVDHSPFLQLPRELILLILDWLSELELLKFRQVSSGSQQLALLTLLARHGVSECQVQSQELSKISSRAIRVLCASYPTLLPNIRRLDLDLTDGDVSHLHPWQSLVHLAERFPTIPHVSFAFSDRSTASERFGGLWNLLPATLSALMGIGNHSRPVVIIHYLNTIAVHPKVPHLLKRALKTPIRPSALAVPVIDKMKLTRKLLSSIATASTRRLLSTISVRSFMDPDAPIGALLILNRLAVCYLDIDEHVLSRTEWTFLLEELYLPALRALVVRIDFDCDAEARHNKNHWNTFSAFLERHDKIELLDFVASPSGHPRPTLESPPFSTSALPLLQRLTASAHVVARILQTTNEFPLLERVEIGAREPLPHTPTSAHKDHSTPENDCNPNDATYVQAALCALVARPSVTALVLHLHGLSLPWAAPSQVKVDPDSCYPGPTSRMETHLHAIEKLELLHWAPESEHASCARQLPAWLALFPGLREVVIAGDMRPQQAAGTKLATGSVTAAGVNLKGGPLVSRRLREAIAEACPRVVVKVELRLGADRLGAGKDT
ncbi:F-box domain-containing protein [Mycena sanguinolenta]|uniref:F-box domain-containing protein n=1 Tax=Mycena sanguinolenta TaxID=230812 RepID=A0A8H6ZHF5_9AGAR|nr:F-box domain-containing protein [Mycena sanguinolenta]